MTSDPAFPPEGRTGGPVRTEGRRPAGGGEVSLRVFVLSVVLGVTLLIYAALHFFSTVYFDRAFLDQAERTSRSVAQETFGAMFQVMKRGWTRAEVEEFLRATGGAFADSAYSVRIYRGPLVERLFGKIDQPSPDAEIEGVLSSGRERVIRSGETLRYIYPLTVRNECLRCHVNAGIGDVNGVIDVRADLGPALAAARRKMLLVSLAMLPLVLGGVFLIVALLSRRIEWTLRALHERVGAINLVRDIAALEVPDLQVNFREFRALLGEIDHLTRRLRAVAVDRDVLEFEVRLLEKFIITSEVVKDWKEHVQDILLEINKVMDVYFLFCIFRVEDEQYDLEVFWKGTPVAGTREVFERVITKQVRAHPRFAHPEQFTILHNVADPARTLELDADGIDLSTKSLFVESPSIGGIVGIGVHSDLSSDPTRHLVVESILTTLLNVVGSIKAIYKYTKELEYFATRDPLTNLYNQRVFWELLDYEVGRSERHGYKAGLLLIDIDNFKNVNDAYGHAFGDRFLREIAATLRQAVRRGDILARYGGDEFTVVLPEADQEQAYSVARRIMDGLARLHVNAPDGVPVKCSASIGAAVLPDHAREAKDLFLIADNMMYRAKSLGKDRISLPSEDDIVGVLKSVGEKTMLIMNAIEERGVFPHFQPIMNVRTGIVEAHETLMRIRVPDGILNANEFVELAAGMGVMNKLDYIVIEKAFEKAAASRYRGLLFINMSPKALIVSEFIPTVRRLVERYGIDPGRVVFEITERDTVRNTNLLERFVLDLKFEGFKFAIDDFGSGFSSFQYIKRFPVDIVKIEGDFIRGMVASGGIDRAVVMSIVALAKELGIKTVAEYVETGEILEAVRAVGIDYAQGYHVGRPGTELVPVAEAPGLETA